VKDVRDALLMGRRSDGKLVDRPLSPHLQVYKWPVSMVLSISHRATGIGLSVGTLLMTWWLVAAATSDSAFATVQGFLGSGFGVFLLFCWVAALLLHLLQGIRHLVWDAGYGFDDRIYRVTGWGVIAATIVTTLIVFIVGLVVW
jgi:succinate dehydrogenase / fumarate reductase cytochrome b subunit